MTEKMETATQGFVLRAFSIFMVLLCIGPLSVHAGVPSVSNLTNFTSIEQDSAAVIGADISFSNGASYSDGYLKFSLTGTTAFDQLVLSSNPSPNDNGAISVSGNDILRGNGAGTDRIGSIDVTENGANGQALKILFSSPLNNAGFESGDTAGWTVYQQDYGTSFEGDAIPYVTAGSGSGTGSVDMAVDAGVTYTVSVQTAQKSSGTYALRLFSSGTIVFDNPAQSGTQPDGYGSLHGPYVLSSEFTAENSDQLYVDWSAVNGGDWYEVFGYLVGSGADSTFGTGDDTRTKLFSQRGDTQAWKTTNVTISSTGSYKFEFICGTYDATGGKGVGASLYVDNIRVVNASAITDAIVTAIARQVTFKNTSDDPPASRTLTVAAEAEDGSTGSANAILNIAGVNDPPTDISLSTTEIDVTAGVNGVVATLSSTDPDSADFTYTLVSGAGDDDNGLFNISGSNLQANDADMAIGPYSIRVETDDTAGGTFEKILSLTITDTDGDGLPDNIEEFMGTNPQDADSDDDGLVDGNAGSEDLNANGIFEPELGETDPRNPDTDGDGIFDGTERGLTASETPDTDLASGNFVADADPATTTDPANADSDGDGLNDGEEDLNRNGNVDVGETNPNDPDSDDDGLNDGVEKEFYGQDWNSDYDNDLIINILDSDSDNDGFTDGDEIAVDKNPLDQTSIPEDRDGDFKPDGIDNCPETPNSGQEDTDADGIGDLCDDFSYIHTWIQRDDGFNGYGLKHVWGIVFLCNVNHISSIDIYDPYNTLIIEFSQADIDGPRGDGAYSVFGDMPAFPGAGNYSIKVTNLDSSIENFSVSIQDEEITTKSPHITFPENDNLMIDNNTLTISWNPLPCDYFYVACGGRELPNVPGNATSVEFSGLSDGNYECTVMARNWRDDVESVGARYFNIEIEADADDDGLTDELDNCPNTPNPGQADSDNDSIGDVCESVNGSGYGYGGGGSSGSPQADSLEVTPLVDFGGQGTFETFEVVNSTRRGQLRWQIDNIRYANGSGWIKKVVPRSGQCTGSSTVSLSVSRSGLAAGIYEAAIPVDSNAGSGSVLVLMEVAGDDDDDEPPAPAPDCEQDSDCDDVEFCNGEELCEDGACIEGDAPCAADELCMEEEQDCWTVSTMTAKSMKNSFRRPLLRAQRCVRLVLWADAAVQFDPAGGMAVFTGPGGGETGVSLNPRGQVRQQGGLIIVPLCIERDADQGTWAVTIETVDGTAMETIKAEFEIR